MAGLPPPDGAPGPGHLPEGLAESRRDQPLSLYVHVPWCRARCGYCDFTTSVLPGGTGPSETGDGDARRRATVGPYLRAVEAELALAAGVLGPRPVTTVYFGGGTPTLLTPGEFQRLLTAVAGRFALDPDAEVTAEANPETLSADYLGRLRATGVNRLSLGLQSAVPHVLATLDRRHTPGRSLDAVGWARRAGFDQVSLDLIYGAPGESADDWTTTLDAALAAGPDHVSAYSLIVENGTPLAARLARGELPASDDDETADKYVVADERFEAAGLPWYELSNWGEPCRHNLAYWLSADWWGLGAGAHSHIDGVRWWNPRRPAAYAARRGSPAEADEILTLDQRHAERLLLELRLRSGLEVGVLTSTERRRAAGLVADGLLAVAASGPVGPTTGLVGPTTRPAAAGGTTDARTTATMTGPPEPRLGGPGGGLPARLVLTLRGRLLADAVTRDLLD